MQRSNLISMHATLINPLAKTPEVSYSKPVYLAQQCITNIARFFKENLLNKYYAHV